MTKRKSTGRALLMSFLSVLLCVSMLIGTTYAWFTDSVTSEGNIIKSGTLEVEMYWKDASATGKQTTYADASKTAIFNYDKWEPGYVEAKNIKICNVGNLALKYQMRILANGVVSTLANVIDVYYVGKDTDAGFKEILERSDLTEDMKLGTLSEVLRNPSLAIATKVCGTLEAKDEDVFTLAFKMQESAGNEYQNLSIGTDFSVQLIATQVDSESDSFDEKYDENADFAAQEKPNALVSQLDEKTASKIRLVDANKNPVLDANNNPVVGMDAAYAFQPTETYEQAMASEHVWSHADFYVYADRKVPANSIALAGYYKLFGDILGIDENSWIGLTADQAIEANTGIRLLGDGMSGITVAYSEICNYGNDGIGFLCGAKDLTGRNVGTTLTVELRLYKVACNTPGCHHSSMDCETGEYVTAGTFTYTFPKQEGIAVDHYDYVVEDLDGLKDAFENGGNVVLSDDVQLEKITPIAPGKEVYLDLNGKTLTVDQNTKSNTLIWVQEGAKLTVAGNGTIDLGDVSTMAIFCPYGELVIENGTFKRNQITTVTDDTTGLFMGAKIAASNVTINGGYFDSGYYNADGYLKADFSNFVETDAAGRNKPGDQDKTRLAVKDNVSALLNHSGYGSFKVYGGTFVGANPAWGDEGCMLPTTPNYLRPWSYYQGPLLAGQTYHEDKLEIPAGYTITESTLTDGRPVYTVEYNK